MHLIRSVLEVKLQNRQIDFLMNAFQYAVEHFFCGTAKKEINIGGDSVRASSKADYEY